MILRASTYRFVDALPLAQQDVATAYRLAPERPEVLLEYGILKRLTGARDGARQAWLNLIRLHEGAPVADLAQRNLVLLDVMLNSTKRVRNPSQRNVSAAVHPEYDLPATSGS